MVFVDGVDGPGTKEGDQVFIDLGLLVLHMPQAHSFPVPGTVEDELTIWGIEIGGETGEVGLDPPGRFKDTPFEGIFDPSDSRRFAGLAGTDCGRILAQFRIPALDVVAGPVSFEVGKSLAHFLDLSLERYKEQPYEVLFIEIKSLTIRLTVACFQVVSLRWLKMKKPVTPCGITG